MGKPTDIFQCLDWDDHDIVIGPNYQQSLLISFDTCDDAFEAYDEDIQLLITDEDKDKCIPDK